MGASEQRPTQLTAEDIDPIKQWVDGEYRAFERSWTDRWNARSSQLPDRLYHYTNGDGVKGIVESATLWGTDPRFLNDTTELAYANTVVARVARDLLRTHAAGSQKTFLEAASLQILDAFVATFGIYVACFCEDDDLLSQWRGYRAGRGGYALGFDPHPMRSGTGLRLRRIAYNFDEQAEWGARYSTS